MDGTQIFTTIPGLSEFGNDVNEKVLYTLQSSRTRATSSDAVLCHILGMTF